VPKHVAFSKQYKYPIVYVHLVGKLKVHLLCLSTLISVHFDTVLHSESEFLMADSRYTSCFRSVTVPYSFRQTGLCSHCPSCSVTFQNSTW